MPKRITTIFLNTAGEHATLVHDGMTIYAEALDSVTRTGHRGWIVALFGSYYGKRSPVFGEPLPQNGAQPSEWPTAVAEFRRIRNQRLNADTLHSAQKL